MKNMTLYKFAEQVASNSPVPGGGSIAAVLSALLNVRINLESINDKEFVNEFKKRADILWEDTVAYEKKILELSPF
ncbi:MAG: cyclodeaminase/cyclohydrolase family protein [Sedimentibacter sp.]